MWYPYSFLNVYFIDYAITVVLIFSPLSPHPVPPTPSGNPSTMFMSVGHVFKFFWYSFSYAVLYIPMAIL